MTTDTRSFVRLPDIPSDPADREAVLARAFLRDALDVLGTKIDARPEHPAQLLEQGALAVGGIVRGAHDVQDDVLVARLHDLHLLDAGNRRERALDERYAGDQRTIAPLQIVGDPSGDALHERQAAAAGTLACARHADVLNAIADEGHAAVEQV